MSILTKLQDLREQDHKPHLDNDEVKAMLEYIRAAMTAMPKWESFWDDMANINPQYESKSKSFYYRYSQPKEAEVLFESTITAARNVIIYDYI